MTRLTELWCWIFGHSFSQISLLIFNIKTNARNAHVGIETAKIECRVCGKTFVHKESSQADHGEIKLENRLQPV